MSGFVCLWCAGSFPSRAGLDAHWRATPECSRNRNVSNATRSKYGNASDERIVPGEATLRLVDAAAAREETT